MKRGMSRTDVLTVVAGAAVLGCVGVSWVLADPTGRGERLQESLANLRAIGSAMNQYRGDHQGFLPYEGVGNRRRVRPDGGGFTGVCSWQFGGKNCSGFWFGNAGGSFDIEAADRPLNPYLYPDFTFTAPTPPAFMGAADPRRARDQARVYKDPADVVGRQEQWPIANRSGRSSYDSIGTSYLAQLEWYWRYNGGGPVSPTTYNRGLAQMARDEGVDPARFVHLTDEFGQIVVNSTNPNSQLIGNHGVANQSVTSFADGHAALVTFRPGRVNTSFVNQDYSLWFEPPGRPAAKRPVSATPQ